LREGYKERVILCVWANSKGKKRYVSAQNTVNNPSRVRVVICQMHVVVEIETKQKEGEMLIIF